MDHNLIWVDEWMGQNRLKLNPGKREFILFGSKPQLAKCISANLNVCGKKVDIKWWSVSWALGLKKQ